MAIGEPLRSTPSQDPPAAPQALEDVAMRLRLTLTEPTVVSAVCDARLRYTWIHNASPDFDGTAVIGRRDTEIADNPGTRALERLKAAVLATGRERRETIGFPLRDRTAWFDVVAMPVRAPGSDAVHGVATTSIDVTGRERALAELESIYRDSPIGLAFFDRGLRLVRVNTAMAAMNGLPIEVHVGRRMSELGIGTAGIVEPIVAGVIATGRAVRDLEVVGHTPARPDVECVWRASYAPVFAGDELLGVNAVVEDYTERRRATLLLAEGERRFRTMADGVPVAIWVTDAQGRVEFANREYCDFFGVTVEQVRDQGWQPLVHPDDVQGYVDAYFAALRGQRAFRARTRVQRADGQWRWIESIGLERHADDGTFLGHVGCSPDVTDLLTTQHALREADRRKDEFLAVLGHELRNPLAPLVNAVRILERSEPLTDRGRRVLDIASRQVALLQHLIDDLLEISRITRDRIELRRSRMLLGAAVHAAIERVGPDCDARGHRIVTHLPPAAVWLDADPVRVAQMLGNLLNNACKYTPDRGRITVEVRLVDEAGVEIAVSDTGIGLDPSALTRVFEPFWQAASVIDRSQGGLGIGLALVRRLAELHGGSVRAESEGPGRGSTFVLRLPLGPAA